ncbi:MAG: glucose-6-phosphate dehydrogenase [Myxococcota bacterium]
MENQPIHQEGMPALPGAETPAPPCILVIFGASGDLTKRLLIPALYNLTCDGLLPERFALVGMAMDALTTDELRARMSRDIPQFSTRKEFDAPAWDTLVSRMHYVQGRFDDDEAFQRLSAKLTALDAELKCEGNVVFYFATSPALFGLISQKLHTHGLTREERGWRRVIVEKPFGTDLASALSLNAELLRAWAEEQIFRIDHYLGKETVQNILAFRFSNGIFEPLWNKNHVDHIQFTVAESVGVEGRGGYYDKAGVLRDMIQNHMFQMLAYLCMEPPNSFQPQAIRNEKAKLIGAVRVMDRDAVATHAVRGQYGPGQKPDGSSVVGYRQEPSVDPHSRTETFAALKLFIDNWRWEGVPIYLRSGKSLWKRGTEIIVQFKKAPEVIFRETPSPLLEANRLIFHIQPDQGIELRFQAKRPGPSMRLQKVNMRFSYGEAFQASRGTGYEVLIYNCMIGDATLFSRSDLVEAAWRIVQPVLDNWSAGTPGDFPNYAAGTWGPKAAFDLIERDGRRWMEIPNRELLQRVPLFENADPLFLNSVVMALTPRVCVPDEVVVRKGDVANEMYVINRGEVEVLDGKGEVLATLREGSFFGEIGLVLSQPRTATIRARTHCDLFVLDRGDFHRVLRDHPGRARQIVETAQQRYNVTVKAESLVGA